MSNLAKVTSETIVRGYHTYIIDWDADVLLDVFKAERHIGLYFTKWYADGFKYAF